MSAAKTKAAALLSILVSFLCGCREADAVLVRVTNAGLAIPTEVSSLRITAANPSAEGTSAPIYESADLTLCGEVETPGCYTTPISVTLRPGAERPDAPVRVEIVAFDALGVAVARDAALFSFGGGARQIDFVLSPRCIHTDCAAQDRACGLGGACVGLVPTSGVTTPDLAPPSASEPITRWYERGQGGAPLALAPPGNTQPGDLVVLWTSIPVVGGGWTKLATVGNFGSEATLYVRRAQAGEASATAIYTLASTSGTQGYVLLVYRGVERYELGLIAQLEPYVYPSYLVPRGGTIGLQLIEVFGTICDAQGQGDLGPRLATPGGYFEEWGPLPSGPSGQRSIDCTSTSYGTAQLWLIPR